MLVTHGLRRAARQAPDEVAYEFEGATVTWRGFEERVARAASGLTVLGVKPGDRIAVMSENTQAFLEVLLASSWCGAVLACMNSRWSAAELVTALADAEADVLLLDRNAAGLAEAVLEHRSGLRLIHADTGQAPPGWASWERLIETSPVSEDAEPDPADIRFLFYTSGTTGRPKGVMLSAANVCASGLMAIGAFGIERQGNFAVCAPLFHIAGAATALAQILAGGRVTLLRKFDAGLLAAAIERDRVTHLLLVPTMINALLPLVAAEPGRFISLRLVIYGAAPISEALMRRALALLPHVGFQQAYAMTETAGIGTILPPSDHDPDGPHQHRLCSIGRAVPGMDLRIVDGDGEDVAPGGLGEIWLRGDSITSGYWRQPEESAKLLRDGWLRSGDGARMDKDGYVYIADRIKDMIITGGENVFSIEVENVLSAHPAVGECAVIGVPDPVWGERVTAVVKLQDGNEPDADALVAFCRERLGGYKVPRRVFFVDDLPKSAAGKILKRELRARFSEGHEDGP